MSHFVVYVLAPSLLEKTPEQYVEKILEPYDENLEVDEYQRRCYCIGQEARSDANKVAETLVGNFENIRKTYWAEVDAKVRAELGDPESIPHAERGKYWDRQEVITANMIPSWEQRIKPIVDKERELFENHPLRDKADPECSSCHGSGAYKTTSNPLAKWDWWSIGGRWTGFFNPEYDVEKDERNYETCFLCQGSGKRNDALGIGERIKDPTYSCNGCSGNGKRLKHASAWASPPSNGNVRKVSEVLELIDKGHKLHPFAVITPDGQWMEKGKMGWFGMVANEKEDWSIRSISILKEFPDHQAIVVDCHI